MNCEKCGEYAHGGTDGGGMCDDCAKAELIIELTRMRAVNSQMLEALKELIAEADDHPGWEGHKYSSSLGFDMARAAIRKAEATP